MRIEEKTYETSSGDMLTTKELILPAKMKSIPTQTRVNSNEKEWRLCTVELIYPDGTIKNQPAQLYEASYEMHPDSFSLGADVEIAVQLEGEARGFAKIQLQSLERIDVNAFIDLEEAIVRNNVVDKELVA